MIKFQRGNLVELDPKDCTRLDTPKPERPWVVVQSNQVKDSLDLMVVPMTGTLNENREPKKQLSSFVFIEGREFRSTKNAPWRKDSYVKCGRVCTVLSTKVKYVGFLSPETMARIDQMLRLCLSLPLRVRRPQKPQEVMQQKPLREKQQKPSYSLVRDIRRKEKK